MKDALFYKILQNFSLPFSCWKGSGFTARQDHNSTRYPILTLQHPLGLDSRTRKSSHLLESFSSCLTGIFCQNLNSYFLSHVSQTDYSLHKNSTYGRAVTHKPLLITLLLCSNIYSFQWRFLYKTTCRSVGLSQLWQTLRCGMLLMFKYMEKCQTLPPFSFPTMTKYRLFFNSLRLLHPKLFSFSLLATDKVFYFITVFSKQK